MKKYLFLALVLLVNVSAFQDKKDNTKQDESKTLDDAIKAIKSDNMKKYLEYLASDELEGRLAGQDGNNKAAKWIAEKVEKWGFKPIGDKKDGKHTFFQAFDEPAKTQNVLGYIEGTDEKLKKEVVVIGAHYDHVGMSGQKGPGKIGGKKGDDKVWNGADDNGSGTTTVLEVARAFAESGLKPKRTVLFIWFSAEEWGLDGSKYHVNNPVFDLENYAAMINLDMVGRNAEKAMAVEGTSTSEKWEELIEKSIKGNDLEIAPSPKVTAGSDHYSFYSKKIPAVHFFTDFHADYHKVTDHVDKIEFERMEKIGKFALSLLWNTANMDERPKFSSAGGKRLGINGDAISKDEAKELKLDDDQGGYKVTQVGEGSVAETAGVETDDIIIEFNGTKLPLKSTQNKLIALIGKAEEDKEIPFVVMRDGKKKELKATWPKKKKSTDE